MKDQDARSQLRYVLDRISEQYWPIIYPSDRTQRANWPDYHMIPVIVDGMIPNGLTGGARGNGQLHRSKPKLVVFAPDNAAHDSLFSALNDAEVNVVQCRTTSDVLKAMHHDTKPGKTRGLQRAMTTQEVKESLKARDDRYAQSSTDDEDSD